MKKIFVLAMALVVGLAFGSSQSFAQVNVNCGPINSSQFDGAAQAVRDNLSGRQERRTLNRVNNNVESGCNVVEQVNNTAGIPAPTLNNFNSIMNGQMSSITSSLNGAMNTYNAAANLNVTSFATQADFNAELSRLMGQANQLMAQALQASQQLVAQARSMAQSIAQNLEINL